VYLFVFSIKQASKKKKLNKIHSPLKILDYSILVRRLVYNSMTAIDMFYFDEAAHGDSSVEFLLEQATRELLADVHEL